MTAFLPLLGYDRQLHMAGFDIKHCIGGITLGKDGLLVPVLATSFSIADPLKKRLLVKSKSASVCQLCLPESGSSPMHHELDL